MSVGTSLYLYVRKKIFVQSKQTLIFEKLYIVSIAVLVLWNNHSMVMQYSKITPSAINNYFPSLLTPSLSPSLIPALLLPLSLLIIEVMIML